jgi:hypothetical protein
MARLIFLREGEGPERIACTREVPVQTILAGLGARSGRYVGIEVPTLPTARPDLNYIRGPGYIVACVFENELGDPFDKVGCYFLEGVSPVEAGNW